jgi:catechol 2,3-dioxygenase-like lactoylglutathione lyase family enzyme
MVPEEEPAERAPAGGIPAATGYRYWTISVTNIEELVAACKAGGYRVRVEPTEVRPGVTIAMVEDPEGNWVEFLRNA